MHSVQENTPAGERCEGRSLHRGVRVHVCTWLLAAPAVLCHGTRIINGWFQHVGEFSALALLVVTCVVTCGRLGGEGVEHAQRELSRVLTWNDHTTRTMSTLDCVYEATPSVCIGLRPSMLDERGRTYAARCAWSC